VLRLQVPGGWRAESYFAGLTGAALLGAVGAAILMMTGVLFVRTSGRPAHPELFTGYGEFNFRPEHDTAFLLAGSALGLGIALALAWAWNRRLRRRRPPAVPSRPLASAAGLACLAYGLGAAGVLAFLGGRRHVFAGSPVPAGYLAALLGIAAVSLGGAAVGTLDWFGWLPERRSHRSPSVSPGRRRLALLDLLVPLFTAAVVYLPGWKELSGKAFLEEHFISWDFFAMGPALAFHHGAALGTGVYSPYGTGWPLVFSLLSPLLKISYGHMMLVSEIYGCLYFAGVYLLLRFLVPPAWAAVGTLLALLIGVFSGTSILWPLWRFPSSTVIRRPFDVWVFLALALHLRTRRPAWAAVAGALTGLAVVFVTDTGLYLVATVAVYWVCVASMDWQGRSRIGALAVSAGCAAAVFLGGLGVASRWTMLRATFWRFWLRPVFDGMGGFTALPLAGRPWQYTGGAPPDGPTIALFVAAVVVYLGVAAHLAIKVLHRRASAGDVVAGCLSVYGLLALVNFAGRSDPFNLPHTLVPLALVLTLLADAAHREMRPWFVRAPGFAAAAARSAWRLAPAAALGGVLLALVATPLFWHYPGLVQALGSKRDPAGLCLMSAPRDACGIPSAGRPAVDQFHAVTADMRALAARGGTVALIDHTVEYYVGAGMAPWGYYVPLLVDLLKQDQVTATVSQLLRDRPAWVLIRTKAQVPDFVVDTWVRLHGVVAQYYSLDHQVGPFEVWRSNGR